MFAIGFRRWCIQLLIWYFQYYIVVLDCDLISRQYAGIQFEYILPDSDYTILFRIQNSLSIINGIINSILSASCGMLLAYQFQHDIITALKIGSCMISVGYYWRITNQSDHTELICNMLGMR
jgi:hypothetical protein